LEEKGGNYSGIAVVGNFNVFQVTKREGYQLNYLI